VIVIELTADTSPGSMGTFDAAVADDMVMAVRRYET
jgi:hypothetical protein